MFEFWQWSKRWSSIKGVTWTHLIDGLIKKFTKRIACRAEEGNWSEKIITYWWFPHRYCLFQIYNWVHVWRRQVYFVNIAGSLRSVSCKFAIINYIAKLFDYNMLVCFILNQVIWPGQGVYWCLSWTYLNILYSKMTSILLYILTFRYANRIFPYCMIAHPTLTPLKPVFRHVSEVLVETKKYLHYQARALLKWKPSSYAMNSKTWNFASTLPNSLNKRMVLTSILY